MRTNQSGRIAIQSAALKIVVLATTALLAACNTTSTSVVPQAQLSSQTHTTTAKHAADRAAILAMAGDYKVTFDFQETVVFQEGYTPKERYVTGAHEIVRVIEDRDDFISLQHILVVGDGDETPYMPIKHWRQDWVYEPATVLSYVGANIWQTENITAEDRTGNWAQIVYQVDDAPRYAAVAPWSHDNGVSSWTSPPSKRPLPRRDATKRDDYHVIVATNRHAITPYGWVHEQDNAKVVLSGDTPETLVHEIGVNTYRHNDSFDVKPAIEYWDKTKGYWSEIRTVWNQLVETHPQFGLTILGEPTELYMQILGIATDVEDGAKSAKEAASEATSLIKEYINPSPKSVQIRLQSKQG